MATKKKSEAGEPVLVTGGAGYIGSHVVRDLGRAGYHPVVIDDLSTGNRDALLCGEFHQVRIEDEATVKALIARHRIRSIVHFAAFIQVEESMSDPLKYYRNNSLNAFRLIRAGIESGVENFIFSSTAAVYGIPESIPVSESAPLNPINPYGRSKLFTEMLLADVAQAHSGFRYVSLRYFNVVGADRQARIGQRYRQPTHLLTLALRTALGRYPALAVFGDDYPTADGTAVRDYIHVDDLSTAHLLALADLKKSKTSQVYNCGYGRGFSVLEVIAAAKRVTGIDFAVERRPRRPGDPPALVADSGLIRRRLGWQPAYRDLDDIIATAWNWELKLVEKPTGGRT